MEVNENSTQLTEEELQALLSTMYGRPLNSVELNAILKNTTDLQIAYRSTYGGLDIIDYNKPLHYGTVISFQGRGELDDVKSATLLEAINSSEVNAKLIYSLFESGQLTLEKGRIREELYSDHFRNQKMKHLNKGNEI